MTNTTRDGTPPEPSGFRVKWPAAVLAALIALCVMIEAALVLSDLGWFGPPRLRQTVYEFGGFWPGLLGSWTPNFPTQPYTMFLTYAFLHGGPVHLIVNMITLYSLGQAVIDRIGSLGFSVLYATTILGGGLAFGLLAETVRPMVGASGALFGLAGALIAWNYVDRFTFRDQLWPVLRAVLFLIALNLVLWWAMAGQLAWQTHLGGFLTGWVVSLLLDPRGRALPD